MVRKKKKVSKSVVRSKVREDVVNAVLKKGPPPKINNAEVVDVKLDKTGVPTKRLPSKIRAQNRAGNIRADTVGFLCFRCERRKTKSSFRQVGYNPMKYDAVCLACRFEEGEAEQKADNLARNIDRSAEREVDYVKIRKDMKSNRERQAKFKASHRHQNAKRGHKAKIENINASEAAKRELARRELLRKKLLYFVHAFHPEYKAGWVHADICARLERFYEDVKAGKNPRLMLFMPPRHGKSTLASKLFPTWLLGHNPSLNIIASSYGLTLPTDFSRYVRARMSEDLFKNTFPKCRLDPNKTNVENWGVLNEGKPGGEYIAAGVGTGIGGRGADILIVDDPLKDSEQADSEVVRRSVWDWFKSTAYIRLSPTGGVLIIMTRWHDDDLAGALIQEERELVTDADAYYEAEVDALYEAYGEDNISLDKVQEIEDTKQDMINYIDRWEVVSYPAVAESDEYRQPDGTIVDTKPEGKSVLLRKKDDALHEGRWPYARLMRIYNSHKRRNMRHWHALYQQKPVPDEGVIFTTEMIHEVQMPPSYVWREWTVLQAWDLAIGEKQQHNYTVGITGVLDPDNRLWILHMVRGRWDIYGIANQVLDQYARYRSNKIGVERGPLELALMPAVNRELASRNKELKEGETKLTPYFLQGKHSLVPITDKLIRARPLESMMQQGAVFWAKGAPWLDNMRHEMLRFPSGVLEDCVDAAAWLARMSTTTPAPRKVEPRDPWLGRQGSWRDRVNRLAASQRGAGDFMAS